MRGDSPVCALLAGQLACGRAQGSMNKPLLPKMKTLSLGSGELHSPEKQPGLEKLASLLGNELFSPRSSEAREGFSLPSLCIQSRSASR